MTRLLLAGAGVILLAGCGSSTSTAPVSANSTESTPVTAQGNVVSTDTSPVSTQDGPSPAYTPTPGSTDTSAPTTDGNAPAIR